MAETEIKPPHCPHCNAELPTVELFNWIFPPWLILEVHCPSCKKSLHFQIAPVGVAASDGPPQRSPLIS